MNFTLLVVFMVIYASPVVCNDIYKQLNDECRTLATDNIYTTYYKGKCYLFVSDDMKNWDEAQKWCEKHGPDNPLTYFENTSHAVMLEPKNGISSGSDWNVSVLQTIRNSQESKFSDDYMTSNYTWNAGKWNNSDTEAYVPKKKDRKQYKWHHNGQITDINDGVWNSREPVHGANEYCLGTNHWGLYTDKCYELRDFFCERSVYASCTLPDHVKPDPTSEFAQIFPGTELNVRCEEGYAWPKGKEPKGNRAICGLNGQWTSRLHSCSKKCYTSAMQLPTGINLTSDLLPSESVAFGTELRTMCDQGYARAEGTTEPKTTVTCGEDGKWQTDSLTPCLKVKTVAKGLSTGAIIGIVCSAVFVLLLVIGIIVLTVWCCKRRRKNMKKRAQATMSAPKAGYLVGQPPGGVSLEELTRQSADAQTTPDANEQKITDETKDKADNENINKEKSEKAKKSENKKNEQTSSKNEAEQTGVKSEKNNSDLKSDMKKKSKKSKKDSAHKSVVDESKTEKKKKSKTRKKSASSSSSSGPSESESKSTSKMINAGNTPSISTSSRTELSKQ